MNIIIDENGTVFKETRKGVYTPEKDIKINKIIKENNKIEKLRGWYSIDTPQDYDYATANFENFYNKINEIIDYINKE